MNNRIRVHQSAPELYKLLIAIETGLHKGLLTASELDLMKIRASQINGCAYCIDMHTKEARKHGESEQRIYLLNAWEETTFFTGRERALLAFTEAVTLIQGHVSDDIYNDVINEFGEEATAQLIIAIGMINAWNRLAISTRLQPGVD